MEPNEEEEDCCWADGAMPVVDVLLELFVDELLDS